MADPSSPVPLPRLLQASVEGGDERWSAWAADLPGRVADAAARWGLALGDPFEPGGSCSWVAPAVDASDRDVVLKVAWRHAEALHEAEGLAAIGGEGAVTVLSFEHVADDTTVLLLERCRPGAELRSRPEPEQHEVLTGLLRLVWSTPLPADHPFRPLSTMADGWIAAAERRLAADLGRMDAGLARDGLALFRELSRPASTDVLLCTDLHAGNVLRAERRPWLLIDPKPYVGDPHYDVTQHLLNSTASLREDPLRLVAEVSERAGLDQDRVRHWLFARCVQELLADTPPPWPGLEELLPLLAPSG